MRQLLRRNRLILYRNKIPEADNSIRILKEQCFGTEPQISPKAIRRFGMLTKLRSVHYPVQYLCASWPFRQLELKLVRPVLIPRFESEHMIEILIARIRDRYSAKQIGDLKFVEYGCGSGALGLSLAKQLGVKGTLVDIKDKCIQLTRRNATRNGISHDHVKLVRADMLAQLHLMDGADIVVANPPYLSENHYRKCLRTQVKRYQDRDALVAQQNGMIYVDHIIGAWRHRSKPGTLMLEFDGRALPADLENHVINDQYGKRRFILLQK